MHRIECHNVAGKETAPALPSCRRRKDAIQWELYYTAFGKHKKELSSNGTACLIGHATVNYTCKLWIPANTVVHSLVHCWKNPSIHFADVVNFSLQKTRFRQTYTWTLQIHNEALYNKCWKKLRSIFMYTYHFPCSIVGEGKFFEFASYV